MNGLADEDGLQLWLRERSTPGIDINSWPDVNLYAKVMEISKSYFEEN